jgi:hypothetical protein
LALQARQNKEKQKANKPSFTEPPIKSTNTDAYSNYLEHQTEQCHNKTVAQRTQDYKILCSAGRSTMTTEKIQKIHLDNREKLDAIRAAKRQRGMMIGERKRRNLERNYKQQEVPENKQEFYGRSIFIQLMWIGKREIGGGEVTRQESIL